MNHLKPLNKDTWREYEQMEETGYEMFLGYLDATERFTPELQRILKLKSLLQMKTELLDLVSSQKAFLKDVSKNWKPETL